MRRDRARGAGAARRVPARPDPRDGPDLFEPRGRRGARGQARACGVERRDSRRRARAPEARHGHGPLGARRAAEAAGRGGGPHVAPGHSRLRPGLRGAAGRAFPRGDRAVCRPDAPRRQQRGRAAAPGGALRRCSLRGRAVRPLALRRGPGRGRARACAFLAELSRAGQAPGAGREQRLRAAVRRGTADLDRDRAGRLRRRVSPRSDRNRGAGRRRAAARGRHGLDGRLRGRARRRGAGGRAR